MDDKDILINSGTTVDVSDISDLNYSMSGMDDTIDLSGITTITIPNNFVTTTGSSTSSYTWSSDYSLNYNNFNAKVNIDADGVKIKEDGDLKIGDRSLKDFMDRVEDRLAILHPNEALEEKWEQLKDLRRQYEALEKDIIEKEKIMKILKEN
jgi:hypothetical protein